MKEEDLEKLDRVVLVDNRPSIDQLRNFASSPKIKQKMSHVTRDMLFVTYDTWGEVNILSTFQVSSLYRIGSEGVLNIF